MKVLLKRAAAVFFAVIIVALSFAVPVSASCEYKFGDIDIDGSITASDARLALRYSVSLEYYTNGHLILGDTDADGKISANDARNLLRYSVKLESPAVNTVTADEEDFQNFLNLPEADDAFNWVTPEPPEINAEPGTFTFTVYGYGHGVGLSQYGALSLEDNGYTYDKIVTHYYTGTEIKYIEEFPYEMLYVGKQVVTEEILARIVYQEIYGVTEYGKYEEALKAMTLCVFTNLAYYGFNVQSRWDVGVASPLSYEELPENLKNIVKEVLGQYITVEGEDKPILAVYSSLAAGMTASSEHIWGGKQSYLTSVPSPFDMQRKNFISQRTYTEEEMKNLITSYDCENSKIEINLPEDPSLWLNIIEHTGSVDETRGYVTKIQVGDTVLTGYNQFLVGLMNNGLRSSCFTVTYTPREK